MLTHVLIKYGLNDCKVKGKKVESENATEEIVDIKSKGKNAKKQQKANENKNAKYFDESKDLKTLIEALNEADEIVKNTNRKDGEPHGYIIQKSEFKPPTEDGAEPEEFRYNIEYHPYLFEQYKEFKFKEFPLFDSAIDE